jgi:transmembrane sensor
VRKESPVADDRRLAPYVQPPQLEGHVDRQWEAIARRRTPRPGPSRWVFVLSAATAASLALAAFFAWRSAAPPAVGQMPVAAVADTPQWLEGSTLETSSAAPRWVLPEGTVIELAPQSRVVVEALRPESVQLALQRGAVSLDVSHVEGRRFVVTAAGAEVVVKGTRFRVELTEGESPLLKVAVARGRVQVRGPGRDAPVRELSEGEELSAPLVTLVDAGEAGDVGPRQKPSRLSQLLKAHRPDEAYASLGPEGFAGELRSAGPARLMELADVARLTGHTREAADAFDALRHRFRTDPRAGLAALELGRLRLDALGDPRGAEEALADALALSPDGPFAEDARARRVQALDEAGELQRCREAKADYLERYPNGLHAGLLTLRCSE